nr:DnaJ domain-containing protein [Variovorax dokdonensis]
MGVPPNATAAEIKDAYRRGAMRWHPDRNPENVGVAERRFKEIGAAYAVLSDPQKRAEYDAQIRRGSAEDAEDADFDAKTASRMFLEEMVELANSLSEGGHNRDVLLGALLGRGLPEALARSIADEVIKRRAQAQADAARQRRERQDRERAAERDRKAREKQAAAEAKREAKKGESGSGTPWGIIGLLALVAVVGIASNGGETSRNEKAAISVSPSAAFQASPPQPQSRSAELPTFKTQSQALEVNEGAVRFAVAAMKANVRSAPGAKNPVVTVLSRGDVLLRSDLGSMNGFVQIEMADGRSGWIAEELLIHADAASHLALSPPPIYLGSSPVAASVISRNDVSAFLQAFAVQTELLSTANGISERLKEIAPLVATASVQRDIDAYRWWSMQARWLADSGEPPQAVLRAASAAVRADPLNVDGLVALGLAMVRNGEKDYALDSTVRVLTVLAPETTNTWVIFAAWAAQRQQTKLATAALDLARRYSRNAKVTEAFIERFGEESNNPGIAAVFKPSANDADSSRSTPRNPGEQAGLSAAPGITNTNISFATGTNQAIAPRARIIAIAHQRAGALKKATGNSVQCPAMSRYVDGYESKLTQLFNNLGYSIPNNDPASSDGAKFVANLCNGYYYSASGMIQQGKIDLTVAEAARLALTPSMSSFLDNPDLARLVK